MVGTEGLRCGEVLLIGIYIYLTSAKYRILAFLVMYLFTYYFKLLLRERMVGGRVLMIFLILLREVGICCM